MSFLRLLSQLFTPPSDLLSDDPLLAELNLQWGDEERTFFDLTCQREPSGKTVHGGLSVLPIWAAKGRIG